MVREGLGLLLDGLDWVQVVGAAGTADAGVRATVELRPDVVVLDLALPVRQDPAADATAPGSGGLLALRRIRADAPAVRVLVLSSHDDAATIIAARDAGALGFVVKTGETGELADALRAVWAGRAALSRDASNALARAADAASRPFPLLTDTEFGILELIARGRSNADIAHELHLAPQTVANACTRIYEKLGVARRTEAALAAHRAGVAL